MALPLIWGQNKTKKAPHTLFETFIQKSQIQSSEGFLGGFFELKIYKNTSDWLLLKEIISQAIRSIFQKREEKGAFPLFYSFS